MRVVIKGRRTKHGMEDMRDWIFKYVLCCVNQFYVQQYVISITTNVTEGGVYIVPTNHHGIN
jgi:hypothetical protein